MLLTRERVNAIRSDHDGTAGYAGQLCPTCRTMHPCQTFILASDWAEHDDNARGVSRR